jgi:hypothetical protein
MRLYKLILIVIGVLVQVACSGGNNNNTAVNPYYSSGGVCYQTGSQVVAASNCTALGVSTVAGVNEYCGGGFYYLCPQGLLNGSFYGCEQVFCNRRFDSCRGLPALYDPAILQPVNCI